MKVLVLGCVPVLLLLGATVALPAVNTSEATAMNASLASPSKATLAKEVTEPHSAPTEMDLQVAEPKRMQPGSGSNPLWTAVLSAAAALFGAVVGYIGTTRNARAAIIQKTNELEIESIERRLTEFIGPFLHLSEENKILAEELKRKQPGGADFRTLTALLTDGWLDGLSAGDRNLLDAVVANGRELRRLISEKGGSAVSLELMPYFSKASAHFRMLELAASGSLDKDPARYSGYVYPRQLDGVMLEEQKRLHDRRETLRSQPGQHHPPMPALVIPTNLRLL